MTDHLNNNQIGQARSQLDAAKNVQAEDELSVAEIAGLEVTVTPLPPGPATQITRFGVTVRDFVSACPLRVTRVVK